MSKIGYVDVTCACCKKTVRIKRVFSYVSNTVGLDGNKHNPIQYELEVCPECQYVSFDISDTKIQVSEGMLNAFRVKAPFDKIQNSKLIEFLKAADVYKKNGKSVLQAYALRLASFYAEEQEESSLSKELLRLANSSLQTYFENIEEMTLDDVATAVYLIDGNRRLGMAVTAEIMSKDLLILLEDVGENGQAGNLRKVIEFERSLIEKRDIKEHLTKEVL